MISTYDFANEITQIVQARHPAYAANGDRIANFEGFCHRVARDFDPVEVTALIIDLRNTADALSALFGPHPNRFVIAASKLESCLRFQF